MQHFISTHPQVLDEELNGPLVLAGLPRTGSTHLQALLCLHSSINCVRYYMTRSPVAPIGLNQSLFGTDEDPRVILSDQMIGFVDYVRPLMGKLHVSKYTGIQN